MQTCLPYFILVAGLGQLILAAASLAIPRVLRWGDDLARVRPLTRQVFWTYAGYIWTTNVAFGLLSALTPATLTDGSLLAACVSGFIALYWLSRVIIQFAYFDRTAFAGDGNSRVTLLRLAEVALVGLFMFLALVYASAFVVNLAGGPP